MFGSQWPESVLKTPNYVYGIDTVGKKIWRTDGNNFQIISDFRVEKFLIDNITLTETEKEPIIGIRNVKTHYNAYKGDVMFTFYDDINTIEEKVWNLCFNETQDSFVTFYSWVPSYSANIDNIMFSFDRDTSRTITKLTSIYPKLALVKDGSFGGTINVGNPAVTYVCIGKLKINNDNNINYTFSLYDDNTNNSERYLVQSGYLYVIKTAYDS
jgi:hypothetical protein